LIQQKVEKKRKERVEKLEWEWKEITDTECVFKEKRQAFCDAQKDGGDHEEEIDKGDNDNDKGTECPPDEQPVSPPSAFPLNFSSMTLNSYIRERPRSRLKFRLNKSINVSCSRWPIIQYVHHYIIILYFSI
jgi:hypothetical protein